MSNFDNFLKTVPNGEPANIGGYNRYRLVLQYKLPIVSFTATTDATHTTVNIGYFDQSGEYRRRGVKAPLSTKTLDEADVVKFVMQAIEQDVREDRFANVPTVPPVTEGEGA